MPSSTEKSSPRIRVIKSIEPMARKTDAWIVDVWGVIHNGVKPFHDACQACTIFRQRGGTVILVSNAPRPWTGVKAQLDAMSIEPDVYDAIITSGDVTRGLIAANTGHKIYHLGPRRDVGVFEGLDVTFASARDAEVIVLTGLFNDEVETPDDYATMLQEFAKRELPMICANPDVQVEKGAHVVYCAGALARAYEALGGKVQYAGKPYPPIYEMAFEKIASVRRDGVDKSRVLCIGDGINTDIRGAAIMGLESLLIPSRVNLSSSKGVAEEEIAAAFSKLDFAPMAAQIGLKW